MYARAWQRAQSSACSLRIARPLLLIGGVCQAAASSEELAAGSESLLQNGQPGHVALMLQAPGKAAGSFLMAPGQVFASLAVAVVDAHRRATMRRRAQAWVRLRELVRKAASRFLTAPCEDFASLAVAHLRHLGSAGHISAEARRWHTLVALVVLGSPMPSLVESSSESDSDSDEADYREIDAQESWRSQPAIVSEGRLPLRQFQIFLSGVHGRTITLEVALDDTVDAVLSKIQDKEGVPWNGPHRLVYNCRTLQRHRTLADYGVCPDAALHLVWLPRGGGICMGQPTVVAPGENIAPQDAAPEAPRQTGASEPATTQTATPLDADAQGPPEPGPSEHLDAARRALVRAEGLASGLAGDLAHIFALAPSGSDPGDQDLRKDLAADAASSDASSPPDHRAEPPAIPHALMLVLSCLDDAGLRREFDAHVDLEDKGERRMSKAGLAKFMGAKGLAHGEAEVERVMKRVDTNGDFEIDFLEFCALARVNTELELVLRSQKLECILASFFPSPNYGLTTAHSVKGVGARARGRQQVCRGGGERAQRLRDGHAGLLQKRPDAVGRSRAAPDRLLRLLCRRRPPKMGRGR